MNDERPDAPARRFKQIFVDTYKLTIDSFAIFVSKSGSDGRLSFAIITNSIEGRQNISQPPIFVRSKSLR
jgi:hypothetical protein